MKCNWAVSVTFEINNIHSLRRNAIVGTFVSLSAGAETYLKILISISADDTKEVSQIIFFLRRFFEGTKQYCPYTKKKYYFELMQLI